MFFTGNIWQQIEACKKYNEKHQHVLKSKHSKRSGNIVDITTLPGYSELSYFYLHQIFCGGKLRRQEINSMCCM
jgi:hypothetical protein